MVGTVNLNPIRNSKPNDEVFENLRNELLVDSNTLTFILKEATNKDLINLIMADDRREILKTLLKYDGIRKARKS